MDEKKDQLQTDLLFINNELQAERQKGAEGDAAKIAQLEQRKADVQYELDGINKAEKEQAIEERVHNEAVPFAIEGVDFKELPAALITIIEKVVKADRRRIYAEHAVELEQAETERDEIRNMYDSSKVSYDLLQEDYNQCARELKEQTAETVRLIAERDDARANRDNAARQLEEAKAEISRLESQIDDYQKAKVLGERQAQAVIDVTPNEVDEINAAIKQFLSSEDWGSIIKVNKPDGTFERVKRDEFEREWTPITPPPLLGGSNDSVSFQGEDTQVDVIDSGVSAPEAPSITFPSETEGTVQTNTVSGAVAEQKDEIIRRLERLEIAVFGQGQVA